MRSLFNPNTVIDVKLSCRDTGPSRYVRFRFEHLPGFEFRCLAHRIVFDESGSRFGLPALEAPDLYRVSEPVYFPDDFPTSIRPSKRIQASEEVLRVLGGIELGLSVIINAAETMGELELHELQAARVVSNLLCLESQHMYSRLLEKRMKLASEKRRSSQCVVS